ncbi:MAG: acetylxylan esterase [Paludibacteraceae bacterium]|nr:acetylxylan esterase [Paludibacteraceae bacterium]
MITSSKKYSFIFMALVTAVLLGACGCEKPKEPVDPNPEYVQEPEDLIWSGKPSFNVPVVNAEAERAQLPIKVLITADKKDMTLELTDTMTVAGNKETNYVVTLKENMNPGFYRAVCFVKGKNVRMFNFGVDPFDIVSAPDMQSDYTEYWQTAKDQLAAVDMNAELSEIEDKSSSARKVYLVEMYSVPDGLEGEPVKIRGYYCEPTDGEKHPVLIHYYGYDTQGSKAKCECPSGGNSKYAEFYLSHRGQYLNNRPASTKNPGIDEDCINIYGDWFAYQFGNKDSYYYRGAFMDAVQAVRFMATRETSDMTKLFAEGSSQGGALCYAAAGLSDIPFTAITPNVAFLGDFPDYFKIVDWPGSTAKTAAKKAGMSTDEMYAFLSYYDTKNLATRISCAVLGTSGLMDGTCPPHTNIAPYNLINNPQSEYHFYPNMTHDYPKNWFSMIEEFRKKFL